MQCVQCFHGLQVLLGLLGGGQGRGAEGVERGTCMWAAAAESGEAAGATLREEAPQPDRGCGAVYE